MRALLILAALLLAGCGAPTEDPPADDATGPIDLAGESGLLFLDLETREVRTYTQTPGLAWMSQNATAITWTEATFAVAVDRSTGGREVVPAKVWARVYDNGTGLELAADGAHLRHLVTGNVVETRPLPPPPAEERTWTAASDDLRTLGAEYATSGRGSCASDIFLRVGSGERTVGCHLEISGDGRVGWTERDRARVREANGTIVDHAGLENPVFTRDGVVMLRVTGRSPVTLTEVVTSDGEVLATMEGPTRLALHDVSADGRYLLVRAFAG